LYQSNHRFSAWDQRAEYFDVGHEKETSEIEVPPTGAAPNVQPEVRNDIDPSLLNSDALCQ
jgi:hypothetical protein